MTPKPDHRRVALRNFLAKRTPSGFLALVLGVVGYGCKRDDPRRLPPASSTSSVAAATSTTAVESQRAAVDLGGGANAPKWGSASQSACVATSKGSLANLASTRADKVLLAVARGRVYAIAYQHSQARTDLLTVSRSGGNLEKIGTIAGVGEPSNFVLTTEAAYFVRKHAIFRMGLSDGVGAEIVKGVAPAVAVTTAGVHFVRCDRKEGDAAFRLRPGEPSPEKLGTITSTSQETCDYRYLAADERDLFVSDWRDRRVLAVSLVDHSVRNVLTAKAFPLRIIVEREHLVLQSATGLSRVARAGGHTTSLSTFGVVPYSTLVADESMFWIFSEIRFTNVVGLYALPKTGGETKPYKAFGVLNPPDSLNVTGFLDMAVDDECLYFARFGHAGQATAIVSLLALRK